MVFEARILWESALGAPNKQSVIHAATDSDMDVYREAWQSILTARIVNLSDDYRAVFDPLITEKDTVTGQVIGVSTGSVLSAVEGNSSTQPLPDSSQGLMQLRTGRYSGGRELRGRVYVPGFVTSTLVGGNFDPAVVTAWNSALAAGLLDTPVGVVWSRTHGIVAPITAATMWSEVAVQRRRRG